MLAAEQDQAEQELPKSICQPRHVRLFVPALNAGSLQRVENGQDRFPSTVKPGAAPGRLRRCWPNENGPSRIKSVDVQLSHRCQLRVKSAVLDVGR
jgi:hypothetical protein